MDEFMRDAEKVEKEVLSKMPINKKKTINEEIVQFKKYDEKIQVSAYDNLLMSFKEVEDLITEIQDDISDIRVFKRLVIFIDNSIELLLKMMISDREEILLYIDEDNKKVLEKYREARNKGFDNLDDYFNSYPLNNNLHTISFSKACDILESYFNVITPHFSERCKKMSTIRNGLIHYSITVQYVDMIMILNLYKDSYMLFLKEYEDLNYIDKLYYKRIKPPQMNYQVYFKIYKLCQNEVKKRLIENDMFLHIIGFVIMEKGGLVLEEDPKNFELIEKKFFSQYARYYEKKDIKKWHQEFQLIYSLMVDADIVREDSESFDPYLVTIGIDKYFLDEIANKYDENQQKDKLKIPKSITQIIREENEIYYSDY